MPQRYVLRALLACLVSVIWWGCNENVGVAGGSDTNPPIVTITLADTFVNVDQGLPFTITATDNISLLTVGWSVTGAATFDTVVIFTATTPSFSSDFTLPLAASVSGTFEITATAADGSGNEGTPDTVTARVFDLQLAAFVLPNPTGPIQAVRVGDSVRVQLRATNSDGLGKVTLDGVAFRGSAVLGTDAVVQRFEPKVLDNLFPVTDTLIIRDLLATPGDLTPELVTLRAVVEDATGNVDTTFVQIQLSTGPNLTVTSPADSAQVAPGFNLGVEILAEGRLLAEVGFLTIGVPSTGDTTFFAIGSQPDTTSESFVFAIPAGTAPGFLTLFPVGQDSAGNPGTGLPITIEIVASGGAGDVTNPEITDSLGVRVEVDDEVIVTGTDLGGMTRLGYLVSTLGGTVVSGDSADFGGTNTNEEFTFNMRLDTVVTTFPQQYTIITFGVDGAGNRGFDQSTDTITVVAGRTTELPMGGTVADGIVNRNLGTAGEVYLTNPMLDRVEVFDIATRSFVADIPVGSRPWGIALWPRDTLGVNADTIIVANSGGTNISIVDVRNRVQRRRHDLPNFIIDYVSTERDPDTDIIQEKVERFDFSDRPQFIGATCRTTGGTACAADSVFVTYSTTPTIDQGQEYSERGTVRWENLTACLPDASGACTGPGAPQGHFFWEHATVGGNDPGGSVDTLRVISIRGRTSEILLYAERGIMVDRVALAFEDTTYVRNSGNFARTFIGEGGRVAGFARVMAYDAQQPLIYDTVFGVIVSIDSTVSPFDTITTDLGPNITDAGISPGVEMSDFISNTAIPVRSIGINFNGLTHLVRADSIYVLNDFLRLTGTIGSGALNYGMDLNFDHAFRASDGGTAGTFSGTGDPDDRLLFAATDDPNIVAFDTFFFGEVANIPIRDPIIGLLRVAKLPTGEQFVVGVTARGVVTVQLPSVTNIFPTPPNWDDKDR
jgi:YVTN family beta-propeller protein